MNDSKADTEATPHISSLKEHAIPTASLNPSIHCRMVSGSLDSWAAPERLESNDLQVTLNIGPTCFEDEAGINLGEDG